MRCNELFPGRAPAPLRRWCDAVTTKDIAHRLIGNDMAQIRQCSDDPVVPPAGVLPSHADDEVSDFTPESRPPRIATVFGTIEFLSYQSPIPRQNGVGLGYTCDSFQGFAAEPLADLRQRRPLRIGEPQSSWQMCSQDPVLRRQTLILQQQFLID